MLIPPVTINILIFLLASFTAYIYAGVMIIIGLLVINSSAINSACSKMFYSRQVGVIKTEGEKLEI
jgi:hypothetical protein